MAWQQLARLQRLRMQVLATLVDSHRAHITTYAHGGVLAASSRRSGLWPSMRQRAPGGRRCRRRGRQAALEKGKVGLKATGSRLKPGGTMKRGAPSAAPTPTRARARRRGGACKGVAEHRRNAQAATWHQRPRTRRRQCVGRTRFKFGHAAAGMVAKSGHPLPGAVPLRRLHDHDAGNALGRKVLKHLLHLLGRAKVVKARIMMECHMCQVL